MKQFDRVRMSSHFPPVKNPLTFFLQLHSVVSISWFYFCNSFYILLNAIFTFRQQFCDWKIVKPCFTAICLNTRPENKPTFSLSRSPRQSFIFVYLLISFFRKPQKRHLFFGFVCLKFFILMSHIFASGIPIPFLKM